jgi:hypothetical protein
MDVDENLATLYPETAGGRIDDPDVRLVGNQQVDIFEPKPRLLQRL